MKGSGWKKRAREAAQAEEMTQETRAENSGKQEG